MRQKEKHHLHQFWHPGIWLTRTDLSSDPRMVEGFDPPDSWRTLRFGNLLPPRIWSSWGGRTENKKCIVSRGRKKEEDPTGYLRNIYLHIFAAKKKKFFPVVIQVIITIVFPQKWRQRWFVLFIYSKLYIHLWIH